MSQRASFVTEYIYCGLCAEAVRAVLIEGGERGKGFCPTQVPSWAEGVPPLPIFAGKVGGLYDGEEVHAIEFELADRLAPLLCHPITVAIVRDDGAGSVAQVRINPASPRGSGEVDVTSCP